MSAENQIADDEDQMAAALSELRQERAPQEESTAPANEPAPETLITPTDDQQDAPGDSQPAQAPATPAAEAEKDELRKTREELHRVQSELGRVGALNRHLNEARSKLEQLQRENAQLRQTAPVTQEAENKSAAAAKLAELSERVKEFPELTALVSAVAESLNEVSTKAADVATRAAAQVIQPLESLRAEAEQRHQQERAAAYQAALITFQSAYPTAVDAIKSQEFQAWIPKAPRQVQDAFRNGSTPDEAIAVMDAFDAHLRRTGKPSIAQYQTTTTQPGATGAAPKSNSTSAARLQAAAGLPSRASGAKGGLPPEDDFEGSLEFFRRQRLRNAQAA